MPASPDRPETDLLTDDDNEIGIETERSFSAGGSSSESITGYDVNVLLSSGDLKTQRHHCSFLKTFLHGINRTECKN